MACGKSCWRSEAVLSAERLHLLMLKHFMLWLQLHLWTGCRSKSDQLALLHVLVQIVESWLVRRKCRFDKRQK